MTIPITATCFAFTCRFLNLSQYLFLLYLLAELIKKHIPIDNSCLCHESPMARMRPNSVPRGIITTEMYYDAFGRKDTAG